MTNDFVKKYLTKYEKVRRSSHIGQNKYWCEIDSTDWSSKNI